MLAALDGGAGLRSVQQVRLVPDDDPAARRLDDAVAGFLSGRGAGRSDAGWSDSGSGRGMPPGGPVALPAGLGRLSAGPRLGAVLAGVAVRRVSGHDTVDVMTAAFRQVCHAQAVFLRALLETGMRRAHSGDRVSRVQSPGEFAAEEARAALVWSRRRADSTFEFAWQLHERLPMLGEAMHAGDLDEARARAFVQWTLGLSDDQAARIITALLPTASGLLVGELIDRIKRAAIAVDPGWAERRYRAAVKHRRVEGSRNDDGTANLHGLDLPIERTAAAGDRIDTLARACKHAGDTRPIDHIRADLYLGMLDGTFDTFTENQIIDHVLTHPLTDTDDPATGDAATGGAATGGTATRGTATRGTATRGTATGGTATGGTATGGTATGDAATGDAATGGTATGGTATGGTATGGTATGDPGGADAGHDTPPSGDTGPSRADCRRGDGGANHPSTAAPHRRPADQAIAADTTDEAASSDAADPGPTSPTSPTGPAGHAGTVGPAGHASPACPADPACDGSPAIPAGPIDRSDADGLARPADPARPGDAGHPRGRWSVRELRVEVATMLGLNEHPAEIAGWDLIPATLARHLLNSMRDAQWRWVICDHHGRPINTGTTRHRPPPPNSTGPPPRPSSPSHRRASIVELQLTAHELPHLTTAARQHGWDTVLADISTQHTTTDGGGGGGVAADEQRRSAGAALRRTIQTRDRCCTHPACRTPATRTDQDHAIDHAHSGPTNETNLGSCCRHDHRLKHDGHWHLHKPAPDTTVWTSPLGHTYITRPPPVMPPLPTPWPQPTAPAATADLPRTRQAPSPEPPQVLEPPPF